MSSVVFLLSLFVFRVALGNASPNFVIFLADDLGYGDVGCFGNNTIRTPNIDKLAANGVKLKHHVTAAAVCTPSRAALLTGRYPVRSGMESSNRNKVFFFAAASGGLPDEEITIAKALKKKNYKTAIIGKWHLGNDCVRRGDGCHHPLNHGFDYFYGLPLSNFKDLANNGESVVSSYIPNFFYYTRLIPVLGATICFFIFKKYKTLFMLVLIFLVGLPIIFMEFVQNLHRVNGILMENLDVIEQPVRLKGLTQRFVKKANAFLNNQAVYKSSFFLYVPFVHVHTALFSADEFSGRSRHGRYGDNIEEMDWAVGRIMDTLEHLGLLNDTMVYFSSDNGGHIEEVGRNGEREGGYNGIFRGGKMMGGMEGGIRVPSIISWPNSFLSGEINSATSQMDLFPTVMELAGIALPNDRIVDGRSLIPLLEGDTRSPHQFLFHYCGKRIHAATYIQPKSQKVWKIHWTTPKFVPGTDRCEYVCHCFGDFVVHHDPPLLYDLTNDPSESRPIESDLNPNYFNIVSQTQKARDDHLSMVAQVPDQFSFANTMWKPWLQPCCNYPFCQCSESNFTS